MSKTTKRIIHLIASSFYGGPEKQIVEHMKILNKGIFTGKVVSFIEKGEPSEILGKAGDEGISNHGIPMSGPLDFRALIKLIFYIKHEKIDLLCTHGFKASVFGFVAARINKIPVINFSRGYTAENKKVAFYEKLERFANRMSDGIVSVSEGQKKKLASFGLYGKKSWVVHNCVSTSDLVGRIDKSRICKEFNIPSDSVIVVSAGRLSPEKGHEYLIKAMPEVLSKRRDVFLMLCGEGVLRRELERLREKLNCIDNIIFTGFRRDLGQIFSIMDIMVLPSLTEGLPNVILEAFAYSKPVIATDVGGVPEIMTHNKTGFLIPEKDHEKISESILKLLEKSDLGRSFGKEGHKLVKSSFTFTAQNKKLESIYKEVLWA